MSRCAGVMKGKAGDGSILVGFRHGQTEIDDDCILRGRSLPES